jgi:MFS family permease
MITDEMSHGPAETAQAVAAPPPPLWRNRAFLLLRGGQAVSVVGSAVSNVAFPLLVLALTGSPAQAGLVGFLGQLPQLLFNLPAGVYVDRWNRKLAMVICDVGRALALGSSAVALFLGQLSLLQLAMLACREGAFAVVYSLAEGAAVPRIVTKEQLPAAYAQNEAVRRSAGMVGQPLGGLLFGLGQILPFAADAISYAVSIVSLLFIRERFQGERPPAARRSLRADLMEGVRWLWGQPFLRTSTLLVAGTNLIFAANYLAVIVLAQERHSSPATIGLIFGAGGIGGLLGALLAGALARRLRLSWVVLSVNWLWALLWPLLALAPTAAAIGAIYALMVFAGPFWNVVLGSYARALVPDELQARVDGAGTTIAWGAIPLGSLLAGGLLQWVGPVSTMWILGALMLFIALAGTFSASIRNAPSLTRVGAPQ